MGMDGRMVIWLDSMDKHFIESGSNSKPKNNVMGSNEIGKSYKLKLSCIKIKEPYVVLNNHNVRHCVRLTLA